MKIIPIHVLEDNYSYILIDEKTKEAAVIDPVEPIKILNVISQTGAKLSRFTFKFYNSISILTNL
jgi:hydroxyacylglutathione hydrolase